MLARSLTHVLAGLQPPATGSVSVGEAPRVAMMEQVRLSAYQFGLPREPTGSGVCRQQ